MATATNTYDPGDNVRLSGTFTSSTGTLLDPTTVNVKVVTPTGTVTTNAATKDSVGQYHYDLSIPAASASTGRWYWRMEGSGAATADEERAFDVRKSQFY